MDLQGSAGVRQPSHRSGKKSKPATKMMAPPQTAYNSPQMYNPYGTPGQNPQLFHDTSNQDMMYGQSSGYPQQGGMYPPQGPSNQGFPQAFQGQQLFADPMVANMAMNYGQALVGQGKDLVDQKLEKYVSVSKLKYYFAVDTSYVAKKLLLLFFPYTHSDWSVKYNQDEPVAPRYDINAPDLYIPAMAFVTYILITGYVFGTQSRFTPEQLGIQSSSALVWLVIEIFAVMLTMYITRIDSQLRTLDVLAYCSYKYVGMIFALLGGLILKSLGYYCILIYFSISTAFFLVRTLKLQLLPERGGEDSYEHGSKRRLYLLLFIACLQPIMMYWLTFRIVHAPMEIIVTRR